MYDKEPLCYECLPEVLPENLEAVQVFQLIQNQHIMSFGGPIDLNLPAMEFVMKILGLEGRKDVFDLAYFAYRVWLRLILDDLEAEKEKAKTK